MWQFHSISIEGTGPNDYAVTILANTETTKGTPFGFQLADGLSKDQATTLGKVLEDIGNKLTLDKILGWRSRACSNATATTYKNETPKN